jgi:WD40 repeat protein
MYPLFQLRPLVTLDAHRDATLGCTFSPPLRIMGAQAVAANGKETAQHTLLACGGKDGRISLWDIYTDV